ncbi:hypothetical protein HDV02_002206 [Globomyces sp. JEL0801]|nr:hypothetical protein HDV02_002206 [Globomyces sp. JEL0801]
MYNLQKLLKSMLILSFVNGQEDRIPTETVQLNTTNGITNWPSMGSVKQKSTLIQFDETDTVPKTYENYSSVIEIGNYSLNAKKCYMYGSVAMEKIDVTFELTDSFGKTKDWYQTLKKWGNSTKPITDEEVSLALDGAFSPSSFLLWKMRLISLTVESAKPSGTGFETLVFLNNVGYAQKWSGEFGGIFNDAFRETILSLYAQNKQRLINFTKVTRVDLVGQTIRIVADRALLTLEVSSISLPLINASITKGTLKLQGLKSIEKAKTTSTDPSLVLPLKVGSGVQYWPSVGTFDKQVSNPKSGLEQDLVGKTFSNSSISISQNTPYKLEMSDFYLYGTASFEKIDIEIYPQEYGFQNRAWYHVLKKWGTSSTRPITDEEFSLAMDSAFNEEVKFKKISAESVTGIGNGFETLGVLKSFSISESSVAYAQKWKGTFGGSITNLDFFPDSRLLLRPLGKERIFKFINVTKVDLSGKSIQIVASKAVLSIDVSGIYTGNSIATVSVGSLTLEGYSSPTGFLSGFGILHIGIIGGILLVMIFVLVVFLRRGGYSRGYGRRFIR